MGTGPGRHGGHRRSDRAGNHGRSVPGDHPSAPPGRSPGVTRHVERHSLAEWRSRLPAGDGEPVLTPPVAEQDCSCEWPAAKAAVGEEAFAAAWARGDATTPEEIAAITMPS